MRLTSMAVLKLLVHVIRFIRVICKGNRFGMNTMYYLSFTLRAGEKKVVVFGGTYHKVHNFIYLFFRPSVRLSVNVIIIVCNII